MIFWARNLYLFLFSFPRVKHFWLETFFCWPETDVGLILEGINRKVRQTYLYYWRKTPEQTRNARFVEKSHQLILEKGYKIQVNVFLTYKTPPRWRVSCRGCFIVYYLSFCLDAVFWLSKLFLERIGNTNCKIKFAKPI